MNRERISLPLLRLVCRLGLRSPLQANGFWGTHLRSALGRHLRELACIMPGIDCAVCSLRHRCAFATAWHSFAALRQRTAPPGITQTAPHPYVVRSLPNSPLSLAGGDRLSFELLLFGPAVQHWTLWLAALQRMAAHGLGARRAPLELLSVEQRGPGIARVLWRRGGNAFNLPLPDELCLLKSRSLGATRHGLRLEFVSPVRLRGNSTQLAGLRPNYSRLRDALARRLGGLLWFCCRVRLPLLAELARTAPGREAQQDWHEQKLERWSSSQQRLISAAGWLGTLWLEDVTPQELQLWLAGSLTGLGSLTSHGLGHYEVEVLS